MIRSRIIFLVVSVFIIELIVGRGCAIKMFVMGEMPAVDQKVQGIGNSTYQGRAQNRRVVILGYK